jgi:hypothetical protein
MADVKQRVSAVEARVRVRNLGRQKEQAREGQSKLE